MGHFDPGLFLWSLATFAGLLLLLSRFAFKPLRRLLAERENGIRDAIQEATQARDEARRLVEEHQAQIAAASREARRIVEAGNKIVQEKQREAAAEARKHADDLMARARDDIEQETRKSLDDLKSTLATLSVRISRQVIRDNLTPERHEALADNFIERLKKTRYANKNRQSPSR